MFEGLKALFRKSSRQGQLALFDMPVRVEGHTRQDGTYVKPYVSKRKHALKPPPHAEHPAKLDPHAFTVGAVVRWEHDKKTVSGRVTRGPDPMGTVSIEVLFSPAGFPAVGATVHKHTAHLTPITPGEGPEKEDLVDRPPEVAEGKVEAPAPGAVGTTSFGASYDATPAQRKADNALAREILDSKDNSEITEADRAVLARYSGTGGIGDSLNEYYTRPDVASAVWQVLERLGGMPGRHILEPSCGTGVFMHTAPAGVHVTGVEMDPTSNRIATILQRDHEIAEAGPLESFAVNDGRQFDGVVGNPPFGLRGSLLAEDKPDIPRAEQYFLDTALDKTKTGGLVALVLPSGVMDASSGTAFRRRVLCKGQFLGAMRMPNTAFKHSQTEVTTDVVFFRRRAGDVANALLTLDEDQLQALPIWDAEFVNGTYFAGRGAPNIMGTPEPGWRAKAGMGNDITVAGSMDGVADGLAKFSPEQPADVTLDQVVAAAGDDQVAVKRIQRAALRSPYKVYQVGDVKTVNGETYILRGEPPRWHRTDEAPEGVALPEHIKAARDIGDRINRFMAGEAGEGAGAIIADLEKYVGKHGIPRKDSTFRAAAQKDQALHRVMAAVNEDGGFSDILTGKRIDQPEASLEATAERLALQKGTFELGELGASFERETALDQLYASDRFAMDGDGWTTMDQYLTGDLWAKLDAVRARLAAAGDQSPATRAKLELQAKRLEAAIDPKSLEDVELAINSAWVPLDVLQAFLDHRHDQYLERHPDAAAWKKRHTLTFEGAVYKIDGATAEGVHDRDYKLLLNYLNRTGVKEEDRPRIERLSQKFKEFVLASPHRAQVEDLYNRNYRGFVQKKFSDAPIDVPGLTTERSVNPYHWSRLRWALASRKGIIAADVGLGKTPRALMLAKLLRIHGQAKKPAIVVPKSVLANWLAEIQAWFPGSKTLVIGETYIEGKNGELKARADTAEQRNQKYHDLAQNQYDFVLMSAPAWNDLDLSPIRKGEYANSDFWTQRGDSLGNAGDKKLKKIREAYDQAMARREFEKRSEVIYFDDLGIDAVIMDEAHAYKNLFSARSRWGQQPKFLGGSGESNRAIDTQYKTRWIREQNGGNNVYMLTATPTKNSPLEIYSMLSHIAPEEFEKRGIRNSEEFIDRYCEFKQDLALDVEGAVEEALITSGFKNMDELRALMRKYIDRQTAEEVGLKLPKAEPVEHLIEMTAQQHAVYAELRALAAESSKDAGGEAHIFSIMDKMGKAAMDLELLGDSYQGAESPKYDDCVKTVKQHVGDGGQIVFCESVLSHAKLKDRLVKAGLKPEEIAIINATEAKASLDRQKISDAFNSGKVKVVIGNKTMEEGVNLQKLTSDIHDLDIPWEPATLQQRHGRGVRQGNKRINEGVRIHRYVAKASFDGYRYQTVAAKKDWQDQLWNGGDRLENLEAAPKISREDMLIMLSADPEAARVKYAENKVIAKAAYEAAQRARAGASYHRFRELARSYAALPNQKTETAARLRARLDEAHEKLSNDPFFDAKDALANPNGVVVDRETGRPFRPGTAVHVTVKDKQPFTWAEGTHKFVVAGVEPGSSTVLLRPYGQAAAAVRVHASAIANRAVDAAYDAKAEEIETAANVLGNVAGRATEEFGGASSDEVKSAIEQASGAVAAAEPAWFQTTGGRAKMWRSIETALTTKGTFRGIKPAEDQIQALVDTAELGLALREHGIDPEAILKPEHLKGLPEAAIVANLDTIRRRLNTKLLNYEASYPSPVPMIGPDGAAKVYQNSYEVRDALKDGRLMLPLEEDRRKALDAWKAAQRERKFKRREKSGGRYSYSADFLPGIEPQYGDRFQAIKKNPMSAADSLFGDGWEREAENELLDEATKAAGAATSFTDKLKAWLPTVKVASYGGHARWHSPALRDLAIAAKNEGVLAGKIDHATRYIPAGDVPTQIFDAANQPQSTALTTLGQALQRAAEGLGDDALARQIGEWTEAPDSGGRIAA